NSLFIVIFFFFSSRRRHTRFSRDWSSDVCSSDLRSRIRPDGGDINEGACPRRGGGRSSVSCAISLKRPLVAAPCSHEVGDRISRSEERRVGKEWRARRSPDSERKKDNRSTRRARK